MNVRIVFGVEFFVLSTYTELFYYRVLLLNEEFKCLWGDLLLSKP